MKPSAHSNHGRSLTNINRALRGERLLDYHQHELMEDTGGIELDECGVASLLADLRHLCDRDGINLDDALALSEIHFQEEMDGCDDWMDAQGGGGESL